MRIPCVRPSSHLTAVLCLTLLLPALAVAATPTLPDGDTAAPLVASHLEWRAPEGAAGAVLTILGPDDFVLRKVYGASSLLSFGSADAAEAGLTEGTYTWELRFVAGVDASLRQKLEAARSAGDEALASRLREQLRRPAVIEPLSGSFRITLGVFGAPAERFLAASTPVGAGAVLAPRDQVIPDDLIVQGSECVGFDCVNNENFGFDTIRLKENNLRIKFEDTSVSAGFPTHDWQLTANDSASGGLEKFSIEDVTAATVPFTVAGSAPNNALFVGSNGKVGFRTATPVLDLHVTTSDTPALRFEQTSAGGFTAQTWDVAGNEANFFVRDTTGGSRLPLRIRPGAPTSSLDISASGKVGFGLASPSFRIDASGGNPDDASANFAMFGNTALDSPRVILRRARGTSGSPTAVLLDDRIGSFVFQAHNGTAFSGNAVVFGASAEENWTSTAQGSRFFVNTTPNGTTAPQVRLTVKNNGRVGIGTTNPSDLLEVNGGNIRVTGGSFIDDGTTLNVPDYVFEPGYNLRSVGDLRAFVAEHGHLPNVPSREEIRSGGLNLSQFQMRLLEKIEELSLYAMQQHDELEALKREHATLRAQVSAGSDD